MRKKNLSPIEERFLRRPNSVAGCQFDCGQNGQLRQYTMDRSVECVGLFDKMSPVAAISSQIGRCAAQN